MKKKKPKLEYRYYKMPEGSPLLALLGKKWRLNYASDADSLHFHNYLEIGYCHKGNGILTLGEEELCFSGGEFTVIPPNFPHLTNSEPGTLGYWEYLYVDTEEILQKLYVNKPKSVERALSRIYARAMMVKIEDEPHIAARIRELLEVMRAAQEFYLEEARGLLTALLIDLVRLNPPEGEGAAAEQEKNTLVIGRAVDYISEHYMEALRVDQLAQECHFSENHFRKVFSAYMGMGPLEYLNTVRIQAACEYLKTTDKSITEIAQLCGFMTNSTFNRNFSRLMGISPSQWRKRPENYEQQLLKFAIHSEEGW